MKYLVWITAMLVCLAGTVAADDPPVPFHLSTVDELLLSQAPPDSPMGGGRRGFGSGPGSMPGSRQMRHLEQFRLLKLLEFLDLKEDQEAQFISKYRQMRKDERETDRRERELVARLADAVKLGKTGERNLAAMVDSIVQIQEESWRARQNLLKQFKSILTVEQWARFIIFHQRFEQEMLEQVRGFRGRDMLERKAHEEREQQDTNDSKF